MSSFLPSKLYPLATFTAIYLFFSGFYAWESNNSEFIFYLAVLLILSPIILTIHRRVHLPIITLWLLSLWGLLHMMGGMFTLTHTGDVLYNFWLIEPYLKYDQLIHAYGFGLSTWLAWLCLKAFQPKIRPALGPLSFSLLVGLGLGAINETIEFLATLFLPETNVGSYQNLGWDLIYNLIGGLITIAGIWIFFPSKSRSQNILKKRSLKKSHAVKSSGLIRPE